MASEYIKNKQEERAAAAAAKVKAKLQARWTKKLGSATKFFDPSLRHGQKVYARYIDDRDNTAAAASGLRTANYFYSNTNTLLNSLYNSLPKPDVSRLHKNDTEDESSRVAASIISRALVYEVQRAPHFDAAIKAAVLDRLVPGMGVAWLRFGTAESPPAAAPAAMDPLAASMPVAPVAPPVEAAQAPPGSPPAGAAPVQPPPVEVPPLDAKLETIFVDTLYWEDFIYEPVRTWEQVTWVGRKLRLSKEEYEKQFGQTDDMVPEKTSDNNLTPKELTEDRYNAWEIWDKTTRTVMFFSCVGYTLLKKVDDPYGLIGFFPCPKPMIANVPTTKCLPITDYHVAQDQYLELDELHIRINLIVQAIKVAGVYDAANPGIARMLGGQENKLIPVDNWGLFAEKGGMKGQIDWFPVETVVQVLENLYKAVEATKNTLYEITGMSDIIRGVSNPYETKGAQEIKAQFASVRMGAFQRDVAVFVRDVLRIMAEMACQLYSDDKFKAIVGTLPEPDLQYIPNAMMILRDDFLSQYKVDIQADSLTQADWSLEKSQRQEMVQAIGQLLSSSSQMVQQQPALAPLMVQLIKFSVVGYKGAAELEGYIDQASDAVLQAAQNPPPDPKAAADQQKLQAEQQKQQMEMQAAQQKQQMEMQTLQMESQQKLADAQLESQQAQQTFQLEMQRMMAEMHNEQQMAQLEFRKMAMELEFMRGKQSIELESAETKAELAEEAAESSSESDGEDE